MRIMCDTNIFLDMLLEREPFADDSARALSLCEEHKLDGYVSASCITDLFYLTRKSIHSDYIITRNKKDFKEFGIPLLDPTELLQQLG